MLKKILPRGFERPGYLLFLARNMYYKNKYRGRYIPQGMQWFERSAILLCDKKSSVLLDDWNYFSRLCNVESYNGAVIDIGRHNFFNKNCTLSAREGIKIGSGCLFGPNVCLYDHNHRFQNGHVIRGQGFYGKPITIGDNVWIGAGCFIGMGVTIGDSCIVAANTVITKDIPPGTIVRNKLEVIHKKRDLPE